MSMCVNRLSGQEDQRFELKPHKHVPMYMVIIDAYAHYHIHLVHVYIVRMQCICIHKTMSDGSKA